MLPCYHVAMLPCYHVAMLPCYHVAMLPCYHVAMLPYYFIILAGFIDNVQNPMMIGALGCCQDDMGFFRGLMDDVSSSLYVLSTIRTYLASVAKCRVFQSIKFTSLRLCLDVYILANKRNCQIPNHDRVPLSTEPDQFPRKISFHCVEDVTRMSPQSCSVTPVKFSQFSFRRSSTG